MSETPPTTTASFANVAFAILCCVIGASAVVMPDSGLGGSVNMRSPVPFIAGSMLAALYAASFWRGIQRQASATASSWAMLTFGSWMLFLWTMFAHVVWQARDTFNTNSFATSGIAPILGAAVLMLVSWGGIREAGRNEWNRMGAWILATLAILFFLAPQHLYASHFARQRAKSSTAGKAQVNRI